MLIIEIWGLHINRQQHNIYKTYIPTYKIIKIIDTFTHGSFNLHNELLLCPVFTEWSLGAKFFARQEVLGARQKNEVHKR